MKIIDNITNTNSRLIGSTSYHLDFIRGFAALLVLFNHFRNIFFVPYSEVENQGFFNLLLYSFTGLGHQAVMVFFVLSGFFITNSVIRSVIKNRWSWGNYLLNRFTRLYIVLIPALLLGTILDIIGLYLYDYSFFPHDMEQRLNFEVFLGNLFFLQGITTPVYGTNDPLWSLSYEFWYYLLFPAMLLIFVSKTKAIFKIFYSLLVISTLIFIGQDIASYFIVWIMGVVILIAPPVNFKNMHFNRLFKTISLALFVISLGISRLGLISNSFIADLFVSFAFSLMIYSIIHLNTDSSTFPKLKEYYFKFAKKVSSFSYTLYLIHFPILIFTFAVFENVGIPKMQPTLTNIIYSILMCIVVIFIAFLISLVTENKTNEVKNMVKKLIKPKTKETKSIKMKEQINKY